MYASKGSRAVFESAIFDSGLDLLEVLYRQCKKMDNLREYLFFLESTDKPRQYIERMSV